MSFVFAITLKIQGMKRKCAIGVILLVSLFSARGQNVFEVDDIFYRVIKDPDASSTFGTVHVCAKTYGQYEDDIVIPNAVKQGNDEYADQYKVIGIDAEAFANCEDLVSVTLPPSVETIGENAFYNCSITSIVIPYGNLKQIPDRAFYCCRLKSIHLPACVTEIGEMSFASGALESFSADGLVTIKDRAFADAVNLNEVILPNTLVSIGNRAFNRCLDLCSLKLPEGLKSIGAYAFCECEKLAEINLPQSVKELKEGAFNHSAIVSVTIPPSISKIEAGVFSCCFRLRSATLPSSVTRIAEYAFSACTSLHAIVLPEKVKLIGDMAFRQCEELEGLYLKAETPPSLGDDILRETNNTCKIYVPDNSINDYNNSEEWSVYSGKIAAYDYSSNEPPVTDYKQVRIKPRQYENFDGKSVDVPDGIEEIASAAFYNSKIEKVVLPSTLTSIGQSAFYKCSNLSSVVIPDSVREIGSGAFADCSSLKQISLPPEISIIDGFVFSGCVSLESVVIPVGITRIGKSAFQNCKSLQRIIIPEGVVAIDDEAFSGCTGLKGLSLPSTLREIGAKAFFKCESLTELTIPKNAEVVKRTAFAGCTNLSEINILSSTSSWEHAIFSGCDNIKTISVSESLSDVNEKSLSGLIEYVKPIASENQMDFVDLGLSVKWATRNIGASFPEDMGKLFAWGETNARDHFSQEEYTLLNNGSYVRYCLEESYGKVDGLSMLSPEDDAAAVLLGHGWRMPTESEIKELIEKCLWEYVNGVGFTVTGPSGNNIIIPCPSYGKNRLWSSSIGKSFLGRTPYGCVLEFSSDAGRAVISNILRYMGLPIRPVKK